MPYLKCPHCHESTFTFAGWADVDHCPECGHVLSERTTGAGAVMGASEPLDPRPAAAGRRREATSETRG